ncbi:VWA domain-containing protein [Halohasta salina]|uniref:VWA domain-containing protein n=1 Tax=Halohasta salina TaxID=2961621 RepID=UPI0020A5E81B|nr:VWA domain-containing protein [Halohasta salina]
MVADPANKNPSSLPFAAIVGQESLKEALLVAVVHDDLSGVVISGEKGTAKSTAVRGLADLLPTQQAVADCPYGCDPDDPAGQCAACRERPREALPVETRSVPLVTLPLGATRDRVVGTLSIEDAMAGDSEFDPGLLARANRGILYVDEVNLLDDHLVDVLLDAAASGVNTVERDGMSVSHPAEFTLVGTMNPEEGELRPQLRDRFDLQATVTGCRNIDDRVAVIDRALGEGEPSEETDETAVDERTTALRESLRTARTAVDAVDLPAEFKRTIADLCVEAGVDGHRADIATARAAMALAALDNRPTVIESDVRTAAGYTLPHRLRSDPFEEPPDPEELLDDQFDDPDGDAPDEEAGDGADEGGSGDDADGESAADDDGAAGEDGPTEGDGSADDGSTDEDGSTDGESTPPEATDDADGATDAEGEGGGGNDAGGTADREPGESDDESTDEDAPEAEPLVPGQQRAAVGEGRAPDVDVDEPAGEDVVAGERGRTTQPGARGRRVRTERAAEASEADAAASVRAAAASGHDRIERADLRRSVRKRETAARIVFVVDASASMRAAMSTAKGVVLELLRDAYQQRDEVAVVAVAGEAAEVLLPPTRSVSLAARHLKELPTGDRTPLADGLDTARELLADAPETPGVAVVVSDGRATVAEGSPTAATREAARRLATTGAAVVVVDAGDDDRGGLVPTIAEATDGRIVPLSALDPAVVSTAADRAVDRSAQRE